MVIIMDAMLADIGTYAIINALYDTAAEPQSLQPWNCAIAYACPKLTSQIINTNVSMKVLVLHREDRTLGWPLLA